jgi:Arm DNA-binding domain
VSLTIKEIENAKPKEYKLADGGGLCLLIQPWGGKFWLWRYRFDGAEKNMMFGEYPLVGAKSSELHQQVFW